MATTGVAVGSDDTIPNEEGQDLRVPLPREWDLTALKSMPVTLYSGRISPPCCKIRFLLEYYQVPYRTVEGKKPDSSYQKIPVIDIGPRQVNDSFIIVKSLAPILQGRPLTHDEEEIEKEVTFGLMIAGEKSTAGSCKELCSCGILMGGALGCILRMAACVLCCVGPRKVGQGKQLKTIQEYGDILREQLASGKFLGGGEKPSVLDVSVFGVMQPFVKVEAAWVEELLGPHNDSLYLWFERMEQATSHVDIFKATE